MVCVTTAPVDFKTTEGAQTSRPTFTWTVDPVKGAKTFEVKATNEKTKQSIQFNQIEGTTWTPSIDLDYGKWSFKVRAIGTDNKPGAWSNSDGAEVKFNLKKWAPDGIQVQSIEQGTFAKTCGFLAALASFASHHPNIVNGHIAYLGRPGERGGNQYMFAVTLYDAGWFQSEWVQVKVRFDGTFSDGDPILSFKSGQVSDRYAFWPLLFQRAYYQLKGEVNDPNGTKANVALTALSGVHTEWYSGLVKWTASQIEALRTGLANHRSMVAGTGSDLVYSPVLQGNHAFAVLGTEVDKETGKLMIKLYNPQGDDSIDNGAFFSISWETFLANMVTININDGL